MSRYGVRAVLLVVLLCVNSCVARRSPEPSRDTSGFLDDYSLLRKGEPGDVALVYRNPKVDWTQYNSVLLEPTTLWRSGRNSLAPVPEGDLVRLVGTLENAVQRQLRQSFRFVDEPGPGVMRIRLAITEARATDPILDVLRGRSAPMSPPPPGPIDPELRRFLEDAAIEGEIRDAQTNELLAAGVDRRRREGALPIDTWADIDRAVDFWADRVCGRLERRTRDG